MFALATLAAGCGGDDGQADELRGRAAATAQSVVLRARLAAAFSERAWLTAFATRARLVSGAASPEALAAGTTLGTASAALADRLGTAFGPAVRDRAIDLLRRQDELWGEAASADALGDARGRAAARAGLTATRTALGALLAKGTGTRRQLDEELAGANARLSAALAAVAAGAADAPVRTATAAASAARPARALALAAEERRSPPPAGSSRSPAGDLAELAAAAFTHASYARASAVALIAAGAGDGPRLRAARSDVDAATDELGQLVASVYGEDAAGRFRAAWGAQGEAFEAYAEAKQARDAAAARGALVRLGTARAGIVGLLGEVDPDGDRGPFDRAVARHADAGTAAIRAAAAGSPKLGPRLRDVAAAARGIGEALVLLATRQFPGKFPA